MEHKNGYLVVLELSRGDPTRSRRTDSPADELWDPEPPRVPARRAEPGLRGRFAAAVTALRRLGYERFLSSR
jgi:hypothetical protein